MSGKIKQVMGPVVDVEFSAGKMPAIYTALKVKKNSLVLEVANT